MKTEALIVHLRHQQNKLGGDLSNRNRDTHIQDIKPMDMKLVDIMPVDIKPVDTKPMYIKPVDISFD